MNPQLSSPIKCSNFFPSNRPNQSFCRPAESSPNIFAVFLTEPKHTESKAWYSAAEAEPNIQKLKIRPPKQNQISEYSAKPKQ